MDRIEPKGNYLLPVSRGFHRSRLEQEWTASAYGMLVPEIRRPVLAGRRVWRSNMDKPPVLATGA